MAAGIGCLVPTTTVHSLPFEMVVAGHELFHQVNQTQFRSCEQASAYLRFSKVMSADIDGGRLDSETARSYDANHGQRGDFGQRREWHHCQLNSAVCLAAQEAQNRRVRGQGNLIKCDCLRHRAGGIDRRLWVTSSRYGRAHQSTSWWAVRHWVGG